MNGSIKTVASVTLAMFATVVVANAEGQWIDFGQGTRSLHVPFGDQSVWIEPAFEDYTFMMFDVCDAMKLEGDDCLIYPMNGTVGGAIATIVEGNPIIVYDRTFHSSTSFDPHTVIAHEVGHHFCGHLHEPNSPEQELEADRFAAAAMRLVGGNTLENILASLESLESRPSVSHPGRRDRLAAMIDGWNNPENAKLCKGQ